MPSPRGHIDRALTPCILKRPPCAQFDQAMNDFNSRTGVGGLMQWREQRFPTRATRVDELRVLGKQFEHTRPVVRLGGIGKRGASPRGRGVPFSSLRDAVPNDVHQSLSAAKRHFTATAATV
jgi:hypothetical protein